MLKEAILVLTATEIQKAKNNKKMSFISLSYLCHIQNTWQKKNNFFKLTSVSCNSTVTSLGLLERKRLFKLQQFVGSAYINPQHIFCSSALLGKHQPSTFFKTHKNRQSYVLTKDDRLAVYDPA